jgi:nitroreductase
MERDGSPNPWSLYDLGLAVGNLTTQASAMGLFVHNMAGFYPDKAHELFALPPGIEPVTMIAVGRLGDPSWLPEKLRTREEATRSRKPLGELFL